APRLRRGLDLELLGEPTREFFKGPGANSTVADAVERCDQSLHHCLVQRRQSGAATPQIDGCRELASGLGALDERPRARRRIPAPGAFTLEPPLGLGENRGSNGGNNAAVAGWRRFNARRACLLEKTTDCADARRPAPPPEPKVPRSNRGWRMKVQRRLPRGNNSGNKRGGSAHGCQPLTQHLLVLAHPVLHH